MSPLFVRIAPVSTAARARAREREWERERERKRESGGGRRGGERDIDAIPAPLDYVRHTRHGFGFYLI